MVTFRVCDFLHIVSVTVRFLHLESDKYLFSSFMMVGCFAFVRFHKVMRVLRD